jgi:putative redox protein
MTDVTPRPPSRVRATWEGDHRFSTGRPDGPTARLDGEGHVAQSPPDALLSALAACAAVDVVDILAKRRTPAEKLVVEAEAYRRNDAPRRFVRINLTFAVEGAGVERVHVERAVRLAFEKYCSVAASLAPDIHVEAMVRLNGEDGAFERVPIFVEP